MTTSQDAVDYLMGNRTFWRWSSDGKAVVWPRGDTIAFCEEIRAVLGHLAPKGLPPFGSVLLLIAAMRGNWTGNPERLLPNILRELPPSSQWQDLFAEVFEGLNKVHDLDASLLESLEAKQILAGRVFGWDSAITSPELAVDVLCTLDFAELDPNHSVRPWDSISDIPQHLFRELLVLRDGLKEITATGLRLWEKTGLESVVTPAPVELPPHLRVRGLLDELVDDPKLRAIARLTRQLMAAVSLPRHLTETSDIQDGGVSDISNRGELDRLLLSELAYDDLTLAVRIAVREALYLRRETPPSPPTGKRAVLLDVGLRSWGLPRVFATAVGLALLATSGPRTQVSCFRNKGSRVRPIDFSSRQGLVTHLESLEPELDCTLCLEEFFERHVFAEEAEPVIVTTHEAFESLCGEPSRETSFRHGLDRHRNDLCVIVATVSREGKLRLMQVTANGVRLVREAKLVLDDLMETKPVLKLRDNRRDRTLPAIFHVQPFPLFLAPMLSPTRNRVCVLENQGVLQVTSDRRLLWWSSKSRGARQVTDQLNGRNVRVMHVDAATGNTSFVITKRGDSGKQHDLYHFSPRSQNFKRVALSIRESVRHFAFGGGFLLAVDAKNVAALDPGTGEIIRSATMGAYTRAVGRFFHYAGEWAVLTLDGARFHFEKLSNPAGLVFETVFDCPGIDGPVAVTNLGQFYFTDSKKVQPIPHRFRDPTAVHSVWPDGSKVILTNGKYGPETRFMIASPLSHEVSDHYTTLESLMTAQCRDYVHSASVRNRFDAIALLPGGQIGLRTHRGEHHRIEIASPDGPLMLTPHAEPFGVELVPFDSFTSAISLGYGLKKAIWNDGSEAFLDGRGLLHLRSSDSKIAEVSMVLTDRVISGWCSDGNVWGATFLVGSDNHVSPRHCHHAVLVPFCERAR